MMCANPAASGKSVFNAEPAENAENGEDRVTAATTVTAEAGEQQKKTGNLGFTISN